MKFLKVKLVYDLSQKIRKKSKARVVSCSDDSVKRNDFIFVWMDSVKKIYPAIVVQDLGEKEAEEDKVVGFYYSKIEEQYLLRFNKSLMIDYFRYVGNEDGVDLEDDYKFIKVRILKNLKSKFSSKGKEYIMLNTIKKLRIGDVISIVTDNGKKVKLAQVSGRYASKQRIRISGVTYLRLSIDNFNEYNDRLIEEFYMILLSRGQINFKSYKNRFEQKNRAI